MPEGPERGEVTDLLRAWSDGDADAFERVLPLVYEELHRMAARYLVGERSSITLQPTALVNELCLRLLGWDLVHWQNRGHFFGVSARMMRRVLVGLTVATMAVGGALAIEQDAGAAGKPPKTPPGQTPTNNDCHGNGHDCNDDGRPDHCTDGHGQDGVHNPHCIEENPSD